MRKSRSGGSEVVMVAGRLTIKGQLAVSSEATAAVGRIAIAAAGLFVTLSLPDGGNWYGGRNHCSLDGCGCGRGSLFFEIRRLL